MIEASDFSMNNMIFINNNIIRGGVSVELSARESDTNITFFNNNITSNDHGIKMDANDFSNNTIVFINNSIIGNGNGVELNVRESDGNITFSNNNITGSTETGIRLEIGSIVNINISQNKINGQWSAIDLYSDPMVISIYTTIIFK